MNCLYFFFENCKVIEKKNSIFFQFFPFSKLKNFLKGLISMCALQANLRMFKVKQLIVDGTELL